MTPGPARDHGRYPDILARALADKMRKGMAPTEAEKTYGFERHTVVKMGRRINDRHR